MPIKFLRHISIVALLLLLVLVIAFIVAESFNSLNWNYAKSFMVCTLCVFGMIFTLLAGLNSVLGNTRYTKLVDGHISLKWVFFALLAVCVLAIGELIWIMENRYDAEVAYIIPVGSSIYLTGSISEGDAQIVSSAVLQSPFKTKKIVVNSHGGSIPEAVRLALVIKKYSLDVEVGRICASACAGYLFPVGKRKLFHESSIIAHHTPRIIAYKHELENGVMNITKTEVRDIVNAHNEPQYYQEQISGAHALMDFYLTRFQEQFPRLNAYSRCRQAHLQKIDDTGGEWAFYTLQAMEDLGLKQLTLDGSPTRWEQNQVGFYNAQKIEDCAQFIKN